MKGGIWRKNPWVFYSHNRRLLTFSLRRGHVDTTMVIRSQILTDIVTIDEWYINMTCFPVSSVSKVHRKGTKLTALHHARRCASKAFPPN